ncbi:MAG TPA: TonB family protein [Sphingomicrobium sp.]|nr:TonB family protein [Sphingomicrobium sp.]
MSSYRGTADRPDKAKAIAAVLAVHLALAFLILWGLNVRIVRRAVDGLTTINIKEPAPPPPPIIRPPAPRPESAPKAKGETAKKAEAAPVVSAEPRPVSVPMPAAKLAATGAAPSAGTGTSGAGAGAGSAGIRAGAGGYADYSRFTPARLVENIPNSAYRQLAATGIPSGLVGVTILVNANGTVSSCRIARSSGDAATDALVCALTVRYVRFEPARDPYGRPIAQDITYFPSWRRR